MKAMTPPAPLRLDAEFPRFGDSQLTGGNLSLLC